MEIIAGILGQFTNRTSKSYVSPLSWRNPERRGHRTKS